MALLDYEAVVTDLEAYLLTRQSFGRKQLLQKLAELRAEHRINESPAERMLRMAEVLDPQPADESRETALVIG